MTKSVIGNFQNGKKQAKRHRIVIEGRENRKKKIVRVERSSQKTLISLGLLLAKVTVEKSLEGLAVPGFVPGHFMYGTVNEAGFVYFSISLDYI